jgi:creatinine amidohydrolase/Fe(II)-dependent formamide hydrolase-like protein
MDKSRMDLDKWIFTENPTIFFENTPVGRCKKEVWDMSEEEVDRVLREDYGIPAPPELDKAGSYIQTTPRGEQIENRRKSDIVFVPVACTENHGMHLPTGQDLFQVTMFLEGMKRHLAKQGKVLNIAWPCLLYGGHPYHHIGMPGTVIMPQEVVVETVVHVMAGLWDDGYRKIILVNNHGQLWNLVTGLQQFTKRYQVPGIFEVFDWHRSVREFFQPNNGQENSMETPFNHACESETSLGLLGFPDMIDMSRAVDTKPEPFLDTGWFDNSTDNYHRPHRWDEGEGHAAIERYATPEGCVGTPTIATADKAKRPILAICRMLELLYDEISTKYPAGEVPKAETMTMRTSEEIAPFLKEPLSEGWKSIWQLPKIGPAESL